MLMFITDVNALEALGSNPHDGRKIHPAYLLEVKKPSESKYPSDYYRLVATIPAGEAFIPLEKSVCPMVKKS
jgi:branched-chain amino acid transport system substrate-binding protein